MEFFFNFFFTFFFATIALLFSLLAYTNKKDAFFYLGMGLLALATTGIIINYEYIIYSATNANLMTLMILLAWLTSLIFLIASKSTQNNSDENITDAFLDDIINSEDEEWDPES